MKKSVWIIGVLAVVIGFIGVYTTAAAPDKHSKKVTVAMTYIPSVQFAPWYVAVEKGFFKAEGFTVDFDYRMDIDALPLVANGKIDFAIAGGDQVITARSHDIPVVYLSTLYAKFPPTIIALTKSGIKKPEDLKGKRIGLPLYGTSLLAIKAVLNKAGIAESDVQLIDVGYTQIASLISGKVDAVVGFANNEPQSLNAQGFQIRQIDSWQYFPLVGHGLITGAKTVTSNPKMVQAMVRATIRGMRYSLDHPTEAYTICLKYMPDLSKDQQGLQKKIFESSMELWQNDYSKQNGLGKSDPKAWQESEHLMRKYGLIEKETPVDELLDLSFLPKQR
jgi:NitT/TauT family transport system substrate-binding protein